jgi:hypothetical protein
MDTFTASLLQYVDDVVCPDAAVQQRVAEQFQFLQVNADAGEASLRVLLSILVDSNFSLRRRQTSGVLVKRLFASSSAEMVGTLVESVQDALLVALADPAAAVQTTVSMVLSSALEILGLSRWTTLLERIAQCAAVGETQGNPQYLLGVARCLHVIFEDCGGDMATLCEDPLQLSALCDVLEKCLILTTKIAPTDAHGCNYETLLLTRATVVWKTCETLFVAGIVPQSSHVWSSGGGGGRFGFYDSDDDSSDDGDGVGLTVKGNTPLKKTVGMASMTPSLSRGQKKIRRDHVMRRLRYFLDRVVDSVGPYLDTNQSRHPIPLLFSAELAGNHIAAELTIVNLLTQMVGFWERCGSLISCALPRLLDAVKASQGHRSGEAFAVVHVAIVDLITEIAQDHDASDVVGANLTGIVLALLNVSLLTDDELEEQLEGETNAQLPDDERRVLLSLARRGVSLLSAKHHQGGDHAPGEDMCDTNSGDHTNDIADQLEHSGESDGSTRDAVAWCWNCLAVSFPSELTSALIPVLVEAATASIASQQHLVFEAVLYTLSELIDELFLQIPQHIMTAFLQQCEIILRTSPNSNPGSYTTPEEGALASMGQHAAIRRQSACCLERAAVGFLTSVDEDNADMDDTVAGEHAVVDAAYVVGILLPHLHDSNKKVQLAVIRGVENVIVHALRRNEDSNGEDDDGKDDASDHSRGSPRLPPLVLQQFYEAFYRSFRATNHRTSALQLWSQIALCQALGRVFEADAETIRVCFGPFSAAGGSHTIVSVLFDCLTTFVAQSFVPSNVVQPSAVSTVIATLSVLCDCLEQCDTTTLCMATPSRQEKTHLQAIWELVGNVMDCLLPPAGTSALHLPMSSVPASFATFRDELVAISLDCVSATCDVFASDDSTAGDVASRYAGDNQPRVNQSVISEAFLATSVAASVLAIVAPSDQNRSRNTPMIPEVDSNLRRACFGVLGDFVTCGAAERLASSGDATLLSVVDKVMEACLKESVFRFAPSSAARTSRNIGASMEEERWGSMDARSNALYCLSHLIRLCHHCRDDAPAHVLQRLFPTFASSASFIVAALLQQLDKDAVDNIHRTMKLNILLAVASVAPMAADDVLSLGDAAVSTLLQNASFYLPTADDPEEVLAVLHGIGHFLQCVVCRRPEATMELLSSATGKPAVARLAVLLSKKAVSSWRGTPSSVADYAGVSELWKEIVIAVLGSNGPFLADALRVNKKEATWLSKFATNMR